MKIWKGKIEIMLFSATMVKNICSVKDCHEYAKSYTRVPATNISFYVKESSLKECMPVFHFCEKHINLFGKMTKDESFEYCMDAPLFFPEGEK